MHHLRNFAFAASPLFVVAFVACATPPDVVYGEATGDGSTADPPEGGSLGPQDATVDGAPASDAGAAPGDSGIDAGNTDTDSASDAPLDADPYAPDDAGPLACDGGNVSACAACPGAPLRCKQSCVSSCDECGPRFLACIHCNGQDQITREVCLPVPANGQLACAGNLCGCDASTQCPTSPGASVLCAIEPTTQADRCLTCGSPGTENAPCPLADGGTGICHIEAGTLPACE